MRKKIDIHKPAIVVDMRDKEQGESVSSQEPATVVVFGVPRGGTTMMAGVVARCGVDIGSDLPVNLEDQAFVSRSNEQMIETIRERNASKSLWGWKFPRAALYLPAIHQEIRNPHYIMVWRDALSSRLRPISNGREVALALENAHKMQKQNIDILKTVPGKYLLVSYEKSILDPQGLAEQVASFIGVDVPRHMEELIEFMRPGTYKSQ